MSRLYLGPVRDYAHAAILQARFEGDRFSSDDLFADTLDASVTAFCLRELAFHCGFDTIGDAGTDALFDAFSEDGVGIDSHSAAESWLEDNYGAPAEWLDALKSAADRATRRKQPIAAKAAVGMFIEGFWG